MLEFIFHVWLYMLATGFVLGMLGRVLIFLYVLVSPPRRFP